MFPREGTWGRGPVDWREGPVLSEQVESPNKTYVFHLLSACASVGGVGPALTWKTALGTAATGELASTDGPHSVVLMTRGGHAPVRTGVKQPRAGAGALGFSSSSETQELWGHFH